MAIGALAGTLGKTFLSGGLSSLGGLVGGIFGSSRDDKRRARQQYRNALRGAGVRPSLLQHWHSDHHQAGQTLIQIAQLDKGVEFLNQTLSGRITRQSVRNLQSLYNSWITTNQSVKSKTSGSPVSADSLKSMLPLLAGAGLLAWVVK